MAAAAAAAAHNAVRRNRMANQSHEEIHEIQNVFHRYDTDASGGIDKRELLKALSELGVECTIKQLDQVMRKFAGGAEELNIIEFNSLVQTLRVARQNGRQVKVKDILPYQDVVRRFYQHGVVMGVFTALIVSNFLSNIIEKEIDPASTLYADTWLQLDNAFNIIFLVELLINMYGCGGPQRREFYSSMWNLFDTVIVVVGLLLMTGADFGPFNKLKLLRAFRVLRLGKRIKSLNKMMEALIGAIPGLLNALGLMLIFFCIYAIVAVEMFRDFGKDGHYLTWDEDGNMTEVSSITDRGYFYGAEYYGTFSRAMYTLFQVMTGESWSEAVARPLIFGLYRGDAAFVASFYVSFILLLQIVMLNVFVAVLLDKFVGGTDDEPWTLDASELLEDAPDIQQDDSKPPAGSSQFNLRLAPTNGVARGGRPEGIGDGMGSDGDLNAKVDLMLQQMAKLQEQVEHLTKLQTGKEEGTGFSGFFFNRRDDKMTA